MWNHRLINQTSAREKSSLNCQFENYRGLKPVLLAQKLHFNYDAVPHHENLPIEIYWKFYHQNMIFFSGKKF